MEFIGRKKELNRLQNVWEKDRYKTCAIYGRRRIGKTTLIEEFIKDKNNISFSMVKGTYEENVQRMAYELIEKGESVEKPELYFVMKALKAICVREKTVIVFDELPNLTQNKESAASELQFFIDWMVDNSDSMCIICGSSISLMINEIKNSSKPLYQRFMCIIELGPLTIDEVRCFHPNMDDRDLLRTYLILGGIPLYHESARGLDFKSMIDDYVLSKTSNFNEDATNIIMVEMGTLGIPSLSVLNALSNGSVRFTEIASVTKLSDRMVSRCLEGLESMRLVSKKHLMCANSKHPTYMITDSPMAFHYRIVRRYSPITATNASKYDSMHQLISSFLGSQFEVYCKDLVARNYPCSEIGSWWGSVPVRDYDGHIMKDGNGKTITEDVDIDLIATVHKGNNRIDLFGECKFDGSEADISVFNKLNVRVESLSGGYNPRLMIIAVNGFEEELLNYASAGLVLLVNLDMIVGKAPLPELP